MDKILVIKPSSLGDIVQAMPVAAALKKQYPRCRIDWFVFHPYRDLFREHHYVDRVWFSPPRGWWSPLQWGDAMKLFSRWKAERYDCAVDLQGLFRSGVLTAFSGARRRVGLSGSREGASWFYGEIHTTRAIHAAKRYLEAASYLGVKDADPFDFGLAAAPPVAQLASENKPYVVIHPFARWATKLWPWAYYERVIHNFPDARFVVVGRGDLEKRLPPNAVDMRKESSLWSLMCILRNAAAVISSDSGPAHLAAAYGVPTLVLFGPTDPSRTAPVGRKVELFKAEGVSCSPCLRRKCRNEEPLLCMTSITPDRLIVRLREVIRSWAY
ncbi:MAG: glycosyltransferase family 9 protein [Methylacidiphilales bacterium]|nr:glycosyltransferase family 9 protein [Candidatus Methylacidiphilales bacterium]MDW8350008.1 glycosyltransferase family 9 protein [Verrucomicrobiae bacterium]